MLWSTKKLIFISFCVLFPCFQNFGVSYQTINFESVSDIAKELANSKYAAPAYNLSKTSSSVTTEQYAQIKYLPDGILWDKKNILFRLGLFPMGSKYTIPVELNEFKGSYMETIRFSSEFYDYGNIKKKMQGISSYAGIKLLYELNLPHSYMDFIQFLENDFFQAIGRNNDFGVSAAGVSINEKVPDVEQETPYFKTLWIGKPNPKATSVSVFGLLDSPSVTGVYEFIIKPGAITDIKVRSKLYFREKVLLLGLSPMISFFLYGEYSNSRIETYNPEVHSSDGLIIADDKDNTSWHPLVNPKQDRFSIYPVNRIKYFGLLQRDRNYSNYLDPVNPYQLKANLWVTPDNDWGKGSVYLIEASVSDKTTKNNIKTFWVPEIETGPGKSYDFNYTLHWSMKPPEQKLGEVFYTFIQKNPQNPKLTDFIIYFDGDGLQKIDSVVKIKVDATISSNAKYIGTPQIMKDQYNHKWRVILTVEPESTPIPPIIDLNCKLSLNNKVITETWGFRWNP